MAVAYLFWLALAPSCRSPMTSRYDWLPTECAPAAFPMTVVRGELLLSDSTAVRIPNGITMRNGWGAVGPEELIGEVRKALPMSLAITWFSFAENKFFGGTFELPLDSLESFFASGFQSPSTGKRRTYESIIVGMAPGGVLSVWVAGEGQVRAVAYLHAQEVPADWKAVLNNPTVTREQYVESVLENVLSPEIHKSLRSDGVPFGTWDRAAVRYELTPIIVGSDARTSAWIDYVNGEREFIDLRSAAGASLRKRAAIRKLEIRWTGRGGLRYSGTVSIDEAESMAAIEKLTKSNQLNALRLVVDLGQAPDAVKVTLRDSQFLLELTKVTIKVFTE